MDGMHYDTCSRCPGEVPPSPWCLTGSGGTSASPSSSADPASFASPLVRNTVQMARLRSPRLSTRVALFFGLIGLLAGLGLTTATYSIARDSLLDQRISRPIVRLRQRPRRQERLRPGAPPLRGLDSKVISDSFLALDVEPGGFSMLTRPYIPLFLQFPASAFPTDAPRFGGAHPIGPASNSCHDGEPYLGIGVHIAAYDTSYVEAFPLGSTERTLRIIVTALLIGSVLAALFATFFGFTTSRGLLKPLTRVADAAGDIAQGALDARLDNSDDPELDRLVRSFNDMADAVQARIEREARFASDVSHELRSPITAMTAAVEVLAARRDELGDRSRQALDLLVEQVRRFDSMVIDLLELSRLDAGAVDGHAEELDLVEWARARRVPLGDARGSDRGGTRRTAPRRGRQGSSRADPRQPPRERRPPRRWSDARLDRTRRSRRHACSSPWRMRARGRRQRARTNLRTIRPRKRRPTPSRHRPRARSCGRARRRHGGEAWVDDRPYGGSRFVVRLPATVRR